MAGKILCFQDGTTPSVPPPNQWRKAPFLETDQDHFWNLVGVEQEDFIVTDDPKFLEDEGPIAGALISPSSIPRLLVERGDFPYSYIEFDGHTGSPPDWKLWTQHVLSREDYRLILERSNILNAIRLFSVLTIRRDNLSLRTLISRWSTDSHTFVASWGEFSPTLEDVAVLYRLPILGDNDVNLIDLAPEDQTVVADLKRCATIASEKGSWFDGSTLLPSQPILVRKKLAYSNWVRYFFKDVDLSPQNLRSVNPEHRSVNGPEFDKPLHLAGFLSYWLDRFIFEGRPEDGLNTRVFPLAAVLARGCAVRLAPMFLGTLYHRLDMIKEASSSSLGRYDISSFISCPFLTLFLFERFPSYSASSPKEFAANDTDGASADNGQALRWSGITGRKLGDLIDYEREFVFRPYAIHINGIEFSMFYFDNDEELGPAQTMNHYQLMFAAMTASCCLPSFTEAGMSLASYMPARVSRQFGFDQGVPHLQGNRQSFQDCLRELSERSYSLTFFIPSYDRQGKCSEGYRKFWKKNLEIFLSFPKELPHPIEPPVIFVGDSSLKLPKKRPTSSRGNASRFAKEFAPTCTRRCIEAQNSMPSGAADSTKILKSKRVLPCPAPKRPRKDDATSTRATSSNNFVEIVEDPVTTSNNVAKGNKNEVGIPARIEDGPTTTRAIDSNFVEIVEDPVMTSNNAAKRNIEQVSISAQAEDGTTSTRATNGNFVDIVEDPLTTSNNAVEGNKEQDVATSTRATNSNFVEGPVMTSNNVVGIPAHAEDVATSTRATSSKFVDIVEDPTTTNNNAAEGSIEQAGMPTRTEASMFARGEDDDFICWACQNLVDVFHTSLSQPAKGQSLGANPEGTGNLKTCAQGFGVIDPHNRPDYIQNAEAARHEIQISGNVAEGELVSKPHPFELTPTVIRFPEFSESSLSFWELCRRVPSNESQASVVNSEETIRHFFDSNVCNNVLRCVEGVGENVDLHVTHVCKPGPAENVELPMTRVLWPVPAENVDHLKTHVLSPAKNVDLSITLGRGDSPKDHPPPADSGQTSTDSLVPWHQFSCSSNKVGTLDRVYERHPETFADFKVQGPNFQSFFLDMLADVIKMLEEKLVRDIDNADISKVNQFLINGKLVGLNLSWLESRVRAIENLASDKRKYESVLRQIGQAEEEIINLKQKLESLESSSLELVQKISAQQERFGDGLIKLRLFT
ncbi:uncharacterized protein LOC132303569 [Cornus florida]|uniref:uncharacterized protein LOC132303569 n=1 Tax=Cornus florida TaxID=4283 RepID=UPI00289811C8|nr:uncharacterized protein LOC132303569 [Cornus florida]